MSRRTTVAGLLGCALLASPIASASQGPTALQPEPAAAESTSPVAATTAGTALLADPVVVPAATGARAWAAGTAPTGIAPDRLSSVVLDAYTRAAALAPERCHLSVPLLAAIGQVESGNMVGRALDEQHRATPAIVGPRLDGGAFAAIKDTDKGQLDGDRKFDRALGPLQFLPSTWRSVGVDLDDDGARDPQSIYDAAGGAMVFLCGEGRDLADDADLRDAVLSYNRSQAYLAQVLRWKGSFDEASLDQLSSLPAFSSWAISTPLEPTSVDVAEAVRPVPLKRTGGATATSAPTSPTGAPTTSSRPTTGGTTSPASPATPGAASPTGPGAPGSPTTTPTDPAATPGGAPTSPGATPAAPATPTAPGSTPAAPGGDASEPAGPTPDPTATGTPSSEPATVPALETLTACVEPTDPSLPAPAPVDADTLLLVTLGTVAGTVVLPDASVVSVDQLCLGTPGVG